MTSPGLPWAQREAIGPGDAFFRTVGLVIAQPARLAGEMWEGGPLSRAEARRFRRMCQFLAWVPLMILWGTAPIPLPPQLLGPAKALPLGAFIIWLWLEWCGAHLAGLMKRQTMAAPRHRRVAILAEYTAAPLALAIVPLCAFIAAAAIWETLPVDIRPLVALVVCLIGGGWVMLWQMSGIVFIYNTMDVKPAEAIVLWGAFLLGFAVRTAVCFLLVPGIVLWFIEGRW